ncbi:tetratricopeptide repeat protein [Pseudomonas aeruginosa]
MKGSKAQQLNELRQALDDARSKHGHEAPEVVPHLIALGDYYLHVRDYSMAEEAFSYALHIVERSEPTAELNGTQLLGRIGKTQLTNAEHLRSSPQPGAEANTEFSRGIQTLERASVLAEQIYGKGSDEYCDSLLNLGLAWASGNRPEQAKPYLKRCIQRYDTTHASQKLDCALNLMADCLLAGGETMKAVPLLERSISICITMHGSDHLTTGMAMDRLAEALKLVGRHSEVLNLDRSVLAIFEKHLPCDDHRLVAVKSRLTASPATDRPAQA